MYKRASRFLQKLKGSPWVRRREIDGMVRRECRDYHDAKAAEQDRAEAHDSATVTLQETDNIKPRR